MKIVFNSRLPEAPCTVFYHDGLSYLDDIHFYDYDHWQEYTVALFMTYKADLEDLKRVKSRYPSLITAIIDPRGAWVKEYLRYADFLIVDSLEMRDYWACSELPIFEYAEYPDIKIRKKIHRYDNEKTIIGYHGNKIHLESMQNHIRPALEKLSIKHEIELWAMYNIETLGMWKRNVPDIKIRHIQWSPENYDEYVAHADIGIVPCFLPEKDSYLAGRLPILKHLNRFNKVEEDYLLRFKMPTNPGRIIVWGLLNVPVVSDFFPSAMQCIDDGVSGLLAYSQGGWFRALDRMIGDPIFRKCCADNLADFITERFSFNIQNEKLKKFLTRFFPDHL